MYIFKYKQINNYVYILNHDINEKQQLGKLTYMQIIHTKSHHNNNLHIIATNLYCKVCVFLNIAFQFTCYKVKILQSLGFKKIKFQFSFKYR